MSDHGTNLYTARTASIARQPRSAPRATIFASVVAVLAVASIAACGTATTSPTTPANAPVDARIYPPTDVPEVRWGPTSADAAERRMAPNEEKQHRAGGPPTLP